MRSACAVAVGTLGFTLAGPAAAAPPQGPLNGSLGPDDIPHPLGAQRRALVSEGIQAQLSGGNVANGVYKTKSGKYVELERTSEDAIFTLLGEFGPNPSPYFGGPPGPLHNEIAEPDRAFDNVTIWVEDFSRPYFQNLLFSSEDGANSVRNYYIEQSSGRYAVHGEVTDWVTVPFNAPHYGSDWCNDIVCWTVWWFIEDGLNAWYQQQLDSGATPDEIDQLLSQFDVWDRYDYDGDGDFNEPDGYLDHFQAVHAGVGQEAGGGAQGSDAIWSHRWYVQLTGVGEGGPTVDGVTVPLGGVQIGGSKYWVGDYTIEPENGGVGVFAHEFAHDLGLPDLYDYGGENSTGFWTLMSSGSWTSDGTEDLGSRPTQMGTWEKLMLGWLDYDVAFSGLQSQHALGPAEYNSNDAQALIVVLPDKEVQTQIATPYEGQHFYYSGADDNLDNYVYGFYSIGDDETLTARVHYDIEPGWDYAYAFAWDYVNDVWYNLDTSVSTDDNPNGQNFGYGITGDSGGEWVELTAALPPAGDYMIGFEYWTDGYVIYPGFSVDAIEVGERPLDGAETPGTLTLQGFEITTGTQTSWHFNAYIAENRRYLGYDDALKTGPYNFGFLDFDEPDLGPYADYVEHFRYQDGLLINYWDTSYADNDVSRHHGGGLLLPVDAHPAPMVRKDGSMESLRVQSFDSTFSLDEVDKMNLHWLGKKTNYPARPGNCMFDDNQSYYTSEMPTASVVVPKTNTQIRIDAEDSKGRVMYVSVGNGAFASDETACQAN
jgi:immune inhibitor A